jgi:hypothetical protein
MKNSRLLKLLRTFTQEELKGLKKFVRSEYFNQRKEVVSLFDLLEKSLKDGRPVPEKAEAYARLFGKSAFDDHRIRMTMSFLYQACCRFLAVQDLLSQSARYQLRLAALLRKRKLSDQFEQAIESANTLHRADGLRNADSYQEGYELLLEQYRFAADQQMTGHLNLQALSDQSDHAFLARKLWQSCFMLSHQAIGNTSYQFGLLDDALASIEQSTLLDIPAIAVYYYCYKALTQPEDPSWFRQFKSCLFQHHALFPSGELRDLYILAINFCIRQYNAGNPDYLREQFDLYKEGLDKQYFLTDGALSRYTYLNAATSALVMQELAWADTFIHTFREHVPEPHRESLFHFNLARLEYHRQHYEKALQLLQKADYKEILLHLAAKTLQLKIFYELREFDLLESHLAAIKAFISRKKVMGYHRENYLNTVYFTQKLLETNLFDKQARAALKQQIEMTGAVAEKEWLLGRL